MKVSRIYTLDLDIAQMLERMDNKSALINRLLRQYFDENGSKIVPIEEKIDNDLKILKQKQKTLKLRQKITKQITAWKLDKLYIKRLLLIPKDVDPENGSRDIDIEAHNDIFNYIGGRKATLQIDVKKFLSYRPFILKYEKIIREMYLGEGDE